MPGPYSPNDNLIGPILHQLAVNIKSQIPSIEYIWEKPPDRAPSDNQVLLPILKIKILDDTNGKVKIRMTIGARHVFRRREFDAGLGQAYTYIMPWLLMLSAWSNDTLGGLTMKVDPTDLAISRLAEGGQIFIALAVNFDILTEFNIDLS